MRPEYEFDFAQSRPNRFAAMIERAGGSVFVKAGAETFIMNSKGQKTGIVLPIRKYRKLIEDLHDLAVIAERRPEPTIPLAELKRRLRRNGVL